MTKFSSMIENLKARREAMVSEGAFSLIDVVVTVAIVVALSVGGFIAYSGLVENAKASATAAAADQVYTASLVSLNDGGLGTPAQIAADYTDSSGVITVIAAGTTSTLQVAAYHEDAAPASIAAIEAAANTTDADKIADAVTVSATDKLVKVRG